jgi:replicative DNA helicase
MTVKAVQHETDATIPHSPEAEESVLGALLIDREAVVHIADTLSPNDFFSTERAEIYRAILALYEERKPADMTVLKNELKTRNLLGEGEGQVKPSYLLRLMNSTPTSVHVGYYAGIVKEKSIARQIIQFGAKATQIGFTSQDSTKGLTRIREELDRLTAISNGDNPAYFTPHEMTLNMINELEPEEKPKKQNFLLRFGLEALDGIDGFEPPSMVMMSETVTTVLAYTSVGKTIFCQQVADANAQYGANVLYLHTELSAAQLVWRRYTRMTGIPTMRQMLASKNVLQLTEKETVQIVKAATIVASEWKGRVDFVHCPSWNIEKISQVVKARNVAALQRRGRGYGLVILDYLQRTGPSVGFGFGDKPAWMGHNATGFGTLINELGVAGFMASQVTRDTDKKDDGDKWYPMPELDSGGWTSAIEQVTNQGLGLTREKAGTNVRLACLKNTFGARDWSVELTFDPERYLFKTQERETIWKRQ